MSLVAFSPNSIIFSADVNANFNGLADGSLDVPANSLATFRDEAMFDFVSSGCIWTGDAYASTRAGSMTSGVVYINGIRLVISAVTAHTFTASKDTYIYLDYTGAISYSEVSNNVASPALPSNSILIGIVITGASTIASVASINQGQEDKLLPIASSIVYTVTDSLGNLICNRSASPSTIGYRRITSGFSTASSSQVQVTGLTCPVIIPGNRKVEVDSHSGRATNSGSNQYVVGSIWDSTVGSGTQVADAHYNNPTGGTLGTLDVKTGELTPNSGTKTYNAAISNGGSGTATFGANTSTSPAFLRVRLN